MSAVQTKDALASAFAETLFGERRAWRDKKQADKRVKHAERLIDDFLEHHKLVLRLMQEVGLAP